MGGATVFPDLGLTLWPRKGSAAFWYNLYQNGEGDVRTRHAACPVLAGTKWGEFEIGRQSNKRFATFFCEKISLQKNVCLTLSRKNEIDLRDLKQPTYVLLCFCRKCLCVIMSELTIYCLIIN